MYFKPDLRLQKYLVIEQNLVTPKRSILPLFRSSEANVKRIILESGSAVPSTKLVAAAIETSGNMCPGEYFIERSEVLLGKIFSEGRKVVRMGD
jgi:hypothetical protein